METPAPPSTSGKGGGRKSRQKDNDRSDEVGDNQASTQAEGATGADDEVPATGEKEKDKKESLKIRIRLNLHARVKLDLDADIKGEVVIGLL